MDRLTIAIVKYKNCWRSQGGGSYLDVAEFSVNSRNLLEVIDGLHSNQGYYTKNYVGINPADAFLPSVHLMGKPLYSEHGMALLYRCAGCGLPDCASIEVRISVQEDVVVWDRFRVDSIDATDDPAERSGRYLDMPIFRFDRKDYQNALAYHTSKRVYGLGV